MPYPRTKAGKAKLARAYRICSKVKDKTKKESCVYKVYKKRVKR